MSSTQTPKTFRRDDLPRTIKPARTVDCRKCKGSGLYESGHVSGDCFSCGGTGTWRYYTAESFAAHDAAAAWQANRVNTLLLAGGYERQLRRAFRANGTTMQQERALTARCTFWLAASTETGTI